MIIRFDGYVVGRVNEEYFAHRGALYFRFCLPFIYSALAYTQLGSLHRGLASRNAYVLRMMIYYRYILQRIWSIFCLNNTRGIKEAKRSNLIQAALCVIYYVYMDIHYVIQSITTSEKNIHTYNTKHQCSSVRATSSG